MILINILTCMRFERFVLILFLSINHVSAFSSDTLKLRIVDFPKDIHLYTKLGPSFSQVEVDNPKIDETLLFKPNPQSMLGFGFSYSWVGFEFSFLLPANSASTNRYGKTEKYDFEAHYTTRRMMVDLTLKNYIGFYFSNADQYIDGWKKGDSYPQSPDLQTVSLAMSFAYIFSPERYSPNAAYTYTKAMRRSGGSWMLGGYFSINGVGSDSSIIPSLIKDYVDPQLDLRAVVFSNIGVSFGYSHLFTLWKKYFVSFTLLPGVSFQNVEQISSTNNSTKKFNTLSMRNITKFSLGKNGDRFYWGLSVFVESTFVNKDKTQLALNSGHTELFLGYRLNTSSWRFMKGVDRVMHPRFFRFITGEPPLRE